MHYDALRSRRYIEDFYSPGARFTKYLTTVLRLSYVNAKVTIDLENKLQRPQGFSQIYLQNRKIGGDCVRALA